MRKVLLTPVGLWWAENDKVVAIYIRDPETEEITRSVLTPAFSPCGLAFDGRSFWCSDTSTGRLYRLSRNGTWSGTVAREGFYHRGEDVLLAWDGIHVWAMPQPGSVAREIIFP